MCTNDENKNHFYNPMLFAKSVFAVITQGSTSSILSLLYLNCLVQFSPPFDNVCWDIEDNVSFKCGGGEWDFCIGRRLELGVFLVLSKDGYQKIEKFSKFFNYHYLCVEKFFKFFYLPPNLPKVESLIICFHSSIQQGIAPRVYLVIHLCHVWIVLAWSKL